MGTKRSPHEATCPTIASILPRDARMSSINSIKADKLLRLIGTPACPHLIDVRIEEDFEAQPFYITGARRYPYSEVERWGDPSWSRAIVICHKGRKLSQGVAAHLRNLGVAAESLDGGMVAWLDAGLPIIDPRRLPRTEARATLWVTRERPKIDRIACPWLIRRFVDPQARFLFVNASDVAEVADKFGAIAFDIDDTFWSHRGDQCTFDVMLDEFGLEMESLRHLAKIVRGADTARLDLAPEASGLLAISLGLSRMFSDDLQQLDAGLTIYDALFRWCRDATRETHNWPAKVDFAK